MIDEQMVKEPEDHNGVFDEYMEVIRADGYINTISFIEFLNNKYPQFVGGYIAHQQEEDKKQAEREAWIPSVDELRAAMVEKKMSLIDNVRTDHLDGEAKSVLINAINAVREYINDRKNKSGLSLIMVAEGIPGDLERTGYGCGKTTLATVIHHANFGYVHDWHWNDGKSINFIQHGRFFEARELMALFDQSDYEPGRMAMNFGNLLVIDDVGREGSLRWEKRDVDSQDAERQNRYYNIINTCYQRDVGVVITSNLSSRQLAATVGGAAWSRLLQMAPKKYRINMTGIPDMRPMLSEDEWF